MGKCDGHTDRKNRIVWRTLDGGLQECVMFTPGYNCPDRGWTGHGVHGMEIRFLLRGPSGCVHLLMQTGWDPGQLTPGHGLSPEGRYGWDSYRRPGEMQYPSNSGLFYCAPVPQYEDQEQSKEDCIWLDGPCYSDCSYLAGDDAVMAFRGPAGEQAIWDFLQQQYAGLDTA